MIPKDAKMADFVLIDVAKDPVNPIRVLQALNGDGFSHFEHAAILVSNGVIAESTSKGVVLSDVRRYNDSSTMWSTGLIDMTDSQRVLAASAARRYADDHVGYAWEDYAALTLHRFGVEFEELKNYIADNHHMICSQLVDQCYQDAGVQLFSDHRWPGYVTPGSLWQLLTSLQNHRATR